MKELFIKEYWDEEHVLYYLHVRNDMIVRQIEATIQRTLYFDVDNPTQGECFMCDVPFSELEKDEWNYISKEEFDRKWNERQNVFFIPSGDIFQLPNVHSFAHGCNCAGAMGKGIALQFRCKYPEMYQQYKALCREGSFVLGQAWPYQIEEGYVYNLGTQASWKVRATLTSIKDALSNMMKHADTHSVPLIAMPAIGAGLGGLPWDEVKHSIIEISAKYPAVRLLVVENYKPDIS